MRLTRKPREASESQRHYLNPIPLNDARPILREASRITTGPIIMPTNTKSTNAPRKARVLKIVKPADATQRLLARGNTKSQTATTPVAPPATSDALDNAESVTQTDISEKHLARLAARAAIDAFYNGASLPFKAAIDLRFRSQIQFNRGANNDQTARAAAGVAAIITYCDVHPDGTFVRGSGRVPGRLIGRTGADANKTFAVGPESGLLSQLVSGPRASHVSGPLIGRGAESAVFKLNFDACRSALLMHNNERTDGSKTRIFTAPLRLLRALEKRGEIPDATPEMHVPADPVPTSDDVATLPDAATLSSEPLPTSDYGSSTSPDFAG